MRDDNTADDIIKKVMEDHGQITEYLSHERQISLQISLNDIYKKILLHYAASYCESRMVDALTDLYVNNCPENLVLTEFVKNQAIRRQYFKFFNWNDSNANQFFKLFGKEFKKHMETKITEDSDLGKSIKSFLELGHLRNMATHDNLATYNLNKTVGEVFELYEDATHFIEKFSSEINKFVNQTK